MAKNVSLVASKFYYFFQPFYAPNNNIPNEIPHGKDRATLPLPRGCREANYALNVMLNYGSSNSSLKRSNDAYCYTSSLFFFFFLNSKTHQNTSLTPNAFFHGHLRKESRGV
uniref:Uncharacterized protein n=1 Tax=Solanum tuberosum TaxID=4113 RepID=M1CWY6_SOLTU